MRSLESEPPDFWWESKIINDHTTLYWAQLLQNSSKWNKTKTSGYRRSQASNSKKNWLHLNQYCLSYLQFFSSMCRACWKNDISQKFDLWSFSLQSDSISIIHVPAALEWPTPSWKNMQIKNERVEFEESWFQTSKTHKMSQFWRSETRPPAGPVLLV